MLLMLMIPAAVAVAVAVAAPTFHPDAPISPPHVPSTHRNTRHARQHSTNMQRGLRTPRNANNVLPGLPPAVQPLNYETILDGLLSPTVILVTLDLNTVRQADVDVATERMESLLRRLQGPDAYAMLEVFRQHNRFNVTLINVVAYIWRLAGQNPGNIDAVDLGHHVTDVFELMFHTTSNALHVKLQALVFVRAILPNRFNAMPQDADDMFFASFAATLVKLFDQFDPLGQANIRVPIDGVPVTLREFDLFKRLKKTILDVVEKLPFNNKFWFNTRGGGDVFLTGKYLEFGNRAKVAGIPPAERHRWTEAVDAIAEIHVVAKTI